jgi:hypothetical protein
MGINPRAWLLAAKVAGLPVATALLLTACASSGQQHLVSSSGGPSASSGSPSAGAEPGVTSFVCQGTINDTLLQWQDSGGDLSGTYEYSALSGQPPQETVSSNSGNLTGTISGTAITLSIGFSQPLYGTLDGSQLTLNVPQQDGSFQAGTCTQGSLSDWNNAVSLLHSQAGTANNQAAQAQAQASQDQSVSQAQQSLASDVSALQNDASTLNNDTSLAGDIKSMQSDYQAEQKDYQTEQSDSCDSMGGDADTVGGDADAVGGDLDTLNGDITDLQAGGIQSVKNDLSAIQNDLSTLQSLGSTPGTDSSGAVAAGNHALKNAASVISWAQGHGKTINGEAQQLATTAQNYASSHCGG